MQYLAVVCPRCNKASATKSNARRHQCPYCGYVMQVDGVAIIAVGDAKAVREAIVRHNTQLS